MTPFDFVLIFFLGGVTLTPMVGNDRSVTNAFAIIMSIALTHFVLVWLKQRSRAFGRVLDGTPLVLLEKGKQHQRTMDEVAVHDQDVMAAARDKGLERLDQIEYAILERNGEISIIQANDES
jgi:uncharacterized membrane protein YcaP (DUF421 family)